VAQGVEEGEMHGKSLLSCKQPAAGWFERNVRERAGYWSRY
jgi:Ni,Fe-hydrogenase III component G